MGRRLRIPLLLLSLAALVLAAIRLAGRSGPDAPIAASGAGDAPVQDAAAPPDPAAAEANEATRQEAASLPLVAGGEPAGAVVGSVVDEDREPVAGAAVSLKILTSSVEELGLKEDGRFALDWPPATTDGAGRFRFDGLPPDASFSVYASAEGLIRGYRQFLAVARGTVELGPIRLERGVVLRGVVVDEIGAPIPGAAVKFERQGDQEEVLTGPDGRFLLPPLKPPVEVRASARGFVSPPPAWRSFEAGAAASEIRIVLERAVSLGGIVVDRTGMPVNGVELLVSMGAARPGEYRTATSGPDGRFTIDDLPPDEVVQITPDSPFCFELDAPVTARPGDTGLRIVLERVATLRLRTRDAEGGTPVAIHRFSTATWTEDPGAAVAGDEILFRASERACSREDSQWERSVEEPTAGEYVLPCPLADGPTDQPIWLAVTVDAEGYRSATTPILRVDPGGTGTSVTLDLERAGIVSGKVVGPGGKPVAGAQISLLAVRKLNEKGYTNWHRVRVRDDHEARGDTRTGEDGVFSLFAAEPRDYRLRVRSKEFAAAQTEAFATGPKQSARGLIVSLTPGGSLAGTVVGMDEQPVKGVMVVAFLPDGRACSASTDGLGCYRIPHLPAGPHRVEIGVCGLPGAGRVGGSWSSRAEPFPPPDLSRFPVVVKEGEETRLDIDLRRPPDGGIIGTALWNGQPARGLEVRAEPVDRSLVASRWDSDFHGDTEAFVEQDGSFRLLALPEGDFRVRLLHGSAELASASATVVRGKAEILCFDLATRSFRGRVLDQDTGQPVFVWVTLDELGARQRKLEIQSGTDGRFALERVPAGFYQATFSHRFPFLTRGREPITRNFDLSSQDVDEEIRIPAFATSRFVLPDDFADGVRVESVVLRGTPDRVLLPAAGDRPRYLLDRLPPVEHTLVLRLSTASGPTEILVPFTIEPLMDDAWLLTARIRSVLGSAGLLMENGQQGK